MFLTIIVFILVLGLLIFVHELGHFITAKRAGIKVEEFGFGYPPRIFGIKKGETVYSLNLLPLGGFVKIYGESGPEQKKKKKDKKDIEPEPEPIDENSAFYKKPIRTRVKVIVAGVAMNLILAAVLLSIGHWIGLPSIIDDSEANGIRETRVQITQVAVGSPAEEAGIKIGDTIKELRKDSDIIAVNMVSDVQGFVNQHLGEEVTVIIQRGRETLEKKAVARRDVPLEQGPLGIGLARTAIVSYSWYKAIIMGITSTINLLWFIIVAFVTILWQLITTGRMAIDIAGPVGIYSLTGQATRLGFIYVLQFTALLSINLAIINILPFPALDGGRLFFLAIEKIKGSPVSYKIESMIHTIGFVLLLVLLFAITWRDIVRLF